MTTLNIKEELRKLAELQEIDKRLFGLRKEKVEYPRLVSELQEEFDAKKAKLKSLEEAKQKLQLKQRDQEVELSSKEDNIKKSHTQLGQLKTNKEYQAKLAEIEGLKTDNSIIEEEILKLMEVIENAKKEVETEKENLKEEEKAHLAKKETLSKKLQEIKEVLINLEGKRKILTGSIEKQILKLYEHILHGKEEIALVKIQNNSCQGCFMHVPAQVINQIKMYDRLIICESCARILYLEEDIET